MTLTSQPPTFSVLLVDDEPNIVSAVRRELSTPPLGRYRYEVMGFTEPEQALQQAQGRAFDVAISDYRMPGMDGLAFLKALYLLQPDCPRIVLSGQTDQEALRRMINETHIYRFIPKPWHGYFLKSSVAQAIDYGQSAVRNRTMADTLRARGVKPPDVPDETVQILVVDDDANVCNAIRRDLSHSSSLDAFFAAMHFEARSGVIHTLAEQKVGIQTCTSPSQALHLAQDTEFACVICDSRMPEMDGLHFLEALVEKQPDCVPILITGAATMDDIIALIDLVHIHGLIEKPWSDFELRASVAKALAWRKLRKENRVLAALSSEQI